MEIEEIDIEERIDLKHQFGTSSVINKAMNQITIPTFKKYPAYKDSGVEWLGKIPEHWEVKRIKHLYKIGRGRVIAQTELHDNCKYPVFSSQTKDDGILGYINTYDFDCEQITWTTDGANAGTIFIRNGKHNCTNVCGTLKPFKKLINNRFNKYSLEVSSPNYKRPDTNGAKIMNNEMAEIFIVQPSLHEQTAIATFLDDKTVKIDHVIAQKEKMIALLKERKQIIIQDLVTGKKVWNDALNSWTEPDKVKDSGVEWIGEIPVGWEVKRLKYLLNELNIRSETGNEELLSLSKYNGVIPKSSLEERAGGAESLVGYKVVKENHLVINKMQAVNGLIAVSKLTGITSPDYSVYFVKEESKLNVNFLCHLILQPQYLAEFKRRVTGVMEGFIRLYTDDLYNVFISLPSIQEQTAIISNIEAQTAKIDKAIALQEQQISKLKELKSTLINSAVTGKIKV